MPGFTHDAFRTLAAGLEVDRLLAEEPDCPVFGLNLACAWPFPGAGGEAYARFYRYLGRLRSWAYVYPPEQTHITLVTFLNFLRHRRPTDDWLLDVEGRVQIVQQKLDGLLRRTGGTVGTGGDHDPGHGRDGNSRSDGVGGSGDEGRLPRAFVLDEPEFCLVPKAGFLRFRDVEGRVAEIRAALRGWLNEDREIGGWVEAGGLNIPGIVHSTCVRFIGRPSEDATERALSVRALNEASEVASAIRIEVDELLLTTETKPYMRGGACLARWKLGA